MESDSGIYTKAMHKWKIFSKFNRIQSIQINFDAYLVQVEQQYKGVVQDCQQ